MTSVQAITRYDKQPWEPADVTTIVTMVNTERSEMLDRGEAPDRTLTCTQRRLSVATAPRSGGRHV
jgi:hypothetical protein